MIEPFIKRALVGVGQPHLLPDCLLIVPTGVHSITFVWCHQLPVHEADKPSV